MNAQDIRRARIILARESRKHFPPGAVRETIQWNINVSCDLVEYRYDFAWRDPASGRITQYCAGGFCEPHMSEVDRNERLAGPAIACIEREVHRKCGMEYAMKNQYYLSLPRGAEGRFV